MSQRPEVSVPVPDLVELADELRELDALLRSAQDLARLVPRAVEQAGEESDPAALVDLAAAPGTIVALVRARVLRAAERVEALAAADRRPRE